MLKGLKFTPTPEKSNHEQLSNDIAEFHRKLKLKEYFYSNENTVPDDSLVRNIVSLYTNISHDLGIKAIISWLTKYPELIHERFSKEFILESIKIILENNNFYFNDKMYTQVRGTAMGTKFAPTYATLVLAYLEEKLYVQT